MRYDLQYLYRVASQMVAKFNVMDIAYPNIDPGSFHQAVRTDVYDELQKWGPARLGELVCYGRGFGYSHEKPTREQNNRTALYEVGYLERFDIQQSGRTLLLTIALATVVAAMYDLVRRRLDEERREKEEHDQAMRDYTHYGPDGRQTSAYR